MPLNSATIIADIKNENFGDKLIFQCIRDKLLESGIEKVIKIGDRHSKNGDIIKFSDPIKVARTIKNSDRVIIGGGGIIQDETSISNLWYFLYFSLLAKILKNPAELLHVGVSQPQHKISRLLVKAICLLVKTIDVRDENSKRIIKQYTNKNVTVSADPVRDITYQENKVSPEIREICKGHFSCFAFRPLLNENNIDYAVQLMRDVTLTTPALEKHLLFSFHNSIDIPFNERIKAECKDTSVIHLQNFSHHDFIYACLKSSINIHTRLHALILCESVKAPYLGISYSRKIDDFLQEIGKPERILGLDQLASLDLVKQIKGTNPPK